MKSLRGKRIAAQDGWIGALDDLYIDAERWRVRHLVVDTGVWLHGRRVLLPPASVAPGGLAGKAIGVALTREEVQNSPGVDADPAVSELLQWAQAHHYGKRSYWEGHVPLRLTPAQFVAPLGAEHPDAEAQDKAVGAEQAARRSHTHSARELLGYRVLARDGALGYLEDVLLDDEGEMPAMIVAIPAWMAHQAVALPPRMVEQIDCARRALRSRLTRAQLMRGTAGA